MPTPEELADLDARLSIAGSNRTTGLESSDPEPSPDPDPEPEPSPIPTPVPPGSVRVPDSLGAEPTVPMDAEWKAWLASVPDGSEIVFPSGREYGYDDTITVEGRSRLTINGSGCVFRALGPGHLRRSGWRVNRCEDITLADMTCVGANPTGQWTADKPTEHQHAFDIRGSHRVTLERVTGEQTYGDGLYVGHPFNPGGVQEFESPSTDVVVRDSTFLKIARMGLGFVNVDGALVEDCELDNIGLSAIDVEPDTDHSFGRRITVRRVKVGKVKDAVFTDGGKGGGERRGSIEVEDLVQTVVAGSCTAPLMMTAPSGKTRSGYTFRRLDLLTLARGAFITRAKAVVIQDSTFTFQRGGGCSISLGVQLARAEVRLERCQWKGFAKRIVKSLSTVVESG